MVVAAPDPRWEHVEGPDDPVSGVGGASRVVVIGAGVGGLAVAARLQARGHAVTLVEQSDRVGGKLASWDRDGFVFDTGPSLLTLPAVYRDLFRRTGRPLEEVLDLQALDPAFGYHFADGTSAVLPGVDPARCATALGDQLGGSAAADWRRLMERAAAMWQITREPFLESPIDGWQTLARLARRPADIRTIAPGTTLRSLGRRTLKDPRLVTLLDRYATYTGSDPRRAPAVLATVPYVEQAFGAWHVPGGLGRIAAALHQRCLDLGVTIHTNWAAARINTQAESVVSVTSQIGEELPATIVIANADASWVYRSVHGTNILHNQERRLARTTPSLAGFVMLLAVRGRTPGLQHHNVWFPKDYDAEFDDVFGTRSYRASPPHDPAIYVCAPDDPQMRPDEDHESWFVLVNAPRHRQSPDQDRGAIDWCEPGLAERYGDQVLERLAERGMDVRSRIVWREIRTPADLERGVGAPGGAIYGTASNSPSAAFTRPANRTAVAGLYLVGGSSHPGGGLPLVGMSARLVAELIGPPKSGRH